MATPQQFWDSVQKSRGELAALVKRAEQYLAKLPKIKRLVKQRDWAADRLAHAKVEKRARLVYDAGDSQVAKYYEEFRTFTKDVLAVFRELRNVLPHVEADRLAAEVHPLMVGSTCRAVQRAAQRLEEFWESRPTSEPPQPARENRLQQFLRERNTTIAAVTKAAQVHKPEMQKWRHGTLPDHSIMSHRIEGVLSGRTSLELRRTERRRPQRS